MNASYMHTLIVLDQFVISKSVFKWLEIYKKAFQEFRDKLEKCAINHHFEENRPTFLFTDAWKNMHDSNNKLQNLP